MPEGRMPHGHPSGFTAMVPLLAFMALLGVAIGWLALSACSLTLPGIGNLIDACPAPSVAVVASFPDAQAESLRGAVLMDQIGQLERQIALAPFCPAPPPAPVPPASPRPRAEAPPPAPRRAETLAACPVRRSDRVVLLLDASTSMKFSYALDPAIERRLQVLQDRLKAEGRRPPSPDFAEAMELIRQAERVPGTSRIEIAKQAMTELVDAADPNVAFDLISFAQCGPPRHEGHFSPAQRSALNRAIANMPLRNSTALTAALEALPGLIPRDGATGRPINVVLISDGYDSCGGDPCAAAARLEQARPEINVNVVAISRGIEAIRCVANKTGGQFLQSGDIANLAPLLRAASGQDVPEHCR
ncbi:VWA domain-containing protein [Azospirillum doebereinerae]|uniref:vWA domain-containing protein n=1 Tax=Azospirillum doebereinerae TaxID=92933 RepID=UPI001EE50A0E|nr:VWA domain-containing protein [Azospirillum doebereinerae]MCG5241329.1 VWA domain-containing protein [Azospirillum doebereinerae]